MSYFCQISLKIYILKRVWNNPQILCFVKFEQFQDKLLNTDGETETLRKHIEGKSSFLQSRERLCKWHVILQKACKIQAFLQAEKSITSF
jgi:hypothetical protein